MNGPMDIPTVEQLIADPAKVASLPPEAAQALLIGLTSLQPLLIQRALIWQQNGHREDDLLTVPEVAKRLRVSDYRAYQLVRQGEIKKTAIGKNSIRVKLSDLTYYLAKKGG